MRTEYNGDEVSSLERQTQHIAPIAEGHLYVDTSTKSLND